MEFNDNIESSSSSVCKFSASKETVMPSKRGKRVKKKMLWNSRRRIKFVNRTKSVKKILKCCICGVGIRTKALLLKHLEATHIGTPISCKQCKRGFNTRASFSYHISFKMCNQNERKYSCDQCEKSFQFKRHFEKHIEGHRRNNCTYCDARLTRRKQLVTHLWSVHAIKLERTIMFSCDFCPKRYVKKRSLYQHLKQHADGKIVCMECGKMNDTAEEHQMHFREHDKDRPWKCAKCQDRFVRRQQYLIHMQRHDRYKCVSCNETFASKLRVWRHKQMGHTVQGLEPQMKCPHCPMAFQRRLSLQIHMKKHLDDKQMYCKYCDKTFRSPYLYFKHCTSTLHEINSPDKQQLVCEICGKLFVKKYQLEQHLHRVHNTHAKQMYYCEHCTHKTTNKTNMERHRALHLEARKEIICDQCGKAFYNLTTLKDHMSYVHLQTKEFQCNQCDKAFKRNSELVRHKASHSELRPYACQICDASYKRSTHLRRHEETQHGGAVTKNRRVQRLAKDQNGVLVPLSEPKKTKTNKNKKTLTSEQQVFSILDSQSGEIMTFTLPEVDNLTTVLSLNNQELLESTQATMTQCNQSNFVLNSTDNNHLTQQLNSNLFLTNNTTIVQATQQIQNSTTCDILIVGMP